MYGTKKTRVLRIEARRRPAAAIVSRPLALGLVRPIVLVRPAARGVPRASPRPAEPAAPRGRLAGLGLRGRARGGQDACRGLLVQHRVEAGVMKLGCADRPDHGRHSATSWSKDLDCVRLDPAARLESSLGPAAYVRVRAGVRLAVRRRWPRHLVLDGLETLDLLLESGNLLIHPRCTRLRDAFGTYSRQRRGGEWIDYPADGHPEEDMIDALRGGVRDAFPEGLAPGPRVQQFRASGIL